MEFGSKRRKEMLWIFLMALMCNLFLIFILKYINSYVILSLLKLVIVCYDIYWFYYIGLWLTLKYYIYDNEIIISGFSGLKKITIPIKEIEGYKKISGKIKGVKLSGLVTNNFGLGRTVIKKIGTTRMFVTNNEDVLYLKTNEINYAISPINVEQFENILHNNNINEIDWEKKFNKVHKLYKEWRFRIPVILTSIIIIVLILNPLILYLTQRLPSIMPISYDAKLNPVTMGTSKEFASAQMTYGVLNMGLFFCMYYASYFYAKYDKKVAYRYLYVPLIIAGAFLFMQFRMLFISI
ncbi:PH domain-containing protein [Clostridium ihumii]|uniref:PH domain-containing protein n=1 Tax=Clostridium ihumii TaxID=1470356 RepID=UPI000686A672|nr:PH domain-containing protein [Clostridium ihumii]